MKTQKQNTQKKKTKQIIEENINEFEGFNIRRKQKLKKNTKTKGQKNKLKTNRDEF